MCTCYLWTTSSCGCKIMTWSSVSAYQYSYNLASSSGYVGSCGQKSTIYRTFIRSTKRLCRRFVYIDETETTKWHRRNGIYRRPVHRRTVPYYISYHDLVNWSQHKHRALALINSLIYCIHNAITQPSFITEALYFLTLLYPQ